jgi:hypothetical protein
VALTVLKFIISMQVSAAAAAAAAAATALILAPRQTGSLSILASLLDSVMDLVKTSPNLLRKRAQNIAKL